MKKIIGNLANKLNKYWIIWIIVITQLVIVFLTYYLEKADKITKEKVDIVFNVNRILFLLIITILLSNVIISSKSFYRRSAASIGLILYLLVNSKDIYNKYL